jgi:peptidoglycan/xylan/chitin deacetylase (PgdA/CDA1 family)
MRKKKLTVFVYHEISNTPSQFCIDYDLNVNPNLFHKQIAWINKNFQIISPSDLKNPNDLPQNSALITFDDGFKGAFTNGIDYLDSLRIPSLMFLNMGHIIDKSPLISAIAIFISKYQDSISKSNRYSAYKNFHLTLNPQIFEEMFSENITLDYSKLFDYQGELASLEMVQAYSNSEYLYYGNHLLNHWNSSSLSENQFKNNVLDNHAELSKFDNFINFFSFPNGQPDICFNDSHLSMLSSLGYDRVFYSSGTNNFDLTSYKLNRMDLTEREYNEIKLGLRLLISKIDNKYFRRLVMQTRKL